MLHKAITAATLTLGLSAFACGKVESLPPLPQALVVVDTNLPVPLAVARLRVDLYREDGTWFESSDFTRDDPHAWPVSFGIYADEGQRRGVAVLFDRLHSRHANE